MRNRKFLLLSISLLSSLSLYAQAADDIVLPEVTTVIDSQKLQAQAEDLPSFSQLFESDESSGSVSIELPDVENQPSAAEAQSEEKKAVKTLFAQGQLGLGYPYLFNGDFSVFSQSEAAPFKIHFNHDSAAAYASNSLNSQYFDSNTSMELETKIHKDNFEWDISGSYASIENGLQNKVSDLTSISQKNIQVESDFIWTFPKGHCLGLNTEGLNYVRYANISNNASIEDWVKKSHYFAINPEFYYYWTGYGIKTGITADYDFEYLKERANRGEFKADFSWGNEFVNLFTDLSWVLSDRINSKITIPFTLGLKANAPLKFSNRNFSIDVRGGMESFLPQVSELEELYKFTGFSTLPYETSYWFASMDLILPVKNSFTSSANLVYKKTYENNGTYRPLLDSSNYVSGLYTYGQCNEDILESKLAFNYFYKIFSASISWTQNWLDIPAFENQMLVSINLSLVSPDSFWGVEGKLDLLLKELPILSLSGYSRVSNTATLVVEMNDILNLVSPYDSRLYAGTYIERSGSLALAVKFNF